VRLDRICRIIDEAHVQMFYATTAERNTMLVYHPHVTAVSQSISQSFRQTGRKKERKNALNHDFMDSWPT
jgi:hypothetical protein